MDSSDRLSASQAYLYEKVWRNGNKRAKELVSQLSPEQKASLKLAKQKLQTKPIIVNLNLHEPMFGDSPMINRLLTSERIFNMFEIEHARMITAFSAFRVRIMLEFKLYGGTKDLQPILGGMSNTEHPNYGLLDYVNYPIGYSVVGFYGWYRFVLKNEVKDRCTFSPADSMYIDNNQAFVWDAIDGVLATRVGEKQSFWFEYVNNGKIPFDSNGHVSYIEAQILGGVLLAKDVEKLCYPETDEYNTEFYERLEELEATFGFKLESY